MSSFIKLIFKVLFWILFLLIMLIGGKIAYDQWQSKVVTVFPFPYQWVEDVIVRQDIVEAPPHVLIVGDRQGKKLATFSENLRSLLSTNLREKLEIESIAEEHEGLHRTLQKLQKLKKMPQVVIYLGGTEEFYEKKFYYNEMPIIQKNLHLFENNKWQTLVTLFPYTSKFLYDKVRLFPIWQEIKADDSPLKDEDIFKKLELSFKIYEEEFQLLMETVKKGGGTLLAITAPLPRGKLPQKICSFSNYESIRSLQEAAFDQIAAKEYKSAYDLLNPLTTKGDTNAMTYYLLGHAALGMGLKAVAFDQFNLELSYDCLPSYGHPMFNALIKKKALYQDVMVLDFDIIVANRLGEFELFDPSNFPQEDFYRQILLVLKIEIERILRL